MAWLDNVSSPKPDYRGDEGAERGTTGVKAHPAIATQQDSILHDRRGNYACPHFEGTRRLIVAEKLDAQADDGRGPQRGRFARVTPGMTAAGPFPRLLANA